MHNNRKLNGLTALTSLDAALDETRLADAKVGRTAEAIGAALGTMRLADVALMLIQDIARLAFALILANADTIQAGCITVGHTRSALSLPIIAGRTFTGIGRNATAAVLAGSVDWDNIRSDCKHDYDSQCARFGL